MVVCWGAWMGVRRPVEFMKLEVGSRCVGGDSCPPIRTRLLYQAEELNQFISLQVELFWNEIGLIWGVRDLFTF
jgi:hypothetical protein